MERWELEGVGGNEFCSDTAPVAAADHRDPRSVTIIVVQSWVLSADLQLQRGLLLGLKGRGHCSGLQSRGETRLGGREKRRRGCREAQMAEASGAEDEAGEI